MALWLSIESVIFRMMFVRLKRGSVSFGLPLSEAIARWSVRDAVIRGLKPTANQNDSEGMGTHWSCHRVDRWDAFSISAPGFTSLIFSSLKQTSLLIGGASQTDRVSEVDLPALSIA